jgi:hypothetical protein
MIHPDTIKLCEKNLVVFKTLLCLAMKSAIYIYKQSIFFLKIKNIKNIKIFLAVSLNLIKQFNFKTCQSTSLSNSSFELNHVRSNSK